MRRNFLGKMGVEVYKEYERQRRKKRQEKQKEQLEKLYADPEGEGRIIMFKAYLLIGAIILFVLAMIFFPVKSCITYMFF